MRISREEASKSADLIAHNDVAKMFKDAGKLIATKVDTPLYLSSCEANIPKGNDNYVWNKEALSDLLLYLDKPSNDCLYICGPTGSGKTSMVLNAAARLKWPVESITVSNATEAQDLIGSVNFSKSRTGMGAGFEFQYGPLAKAMMNGEILLINEIDTMRGGQLTELNDVLDGRDLVVTQNHGEVIHPAPGFRVIATGNTRGNGEGMGNYEGTRNLNAAFMDRFRLIELNYQPKKEIVKLIKKHSSSFPDELTDRMANFAVKIREAAASESISVPLSNRSLLRTIDMMEQAGALTLQDAVHKAYSNKLPSYEREAVDNTLESIFGVKTDGGYADLGLDEYFDRQKKTKNPTKSADPVRAELSAEFKDDDESVMQKAHEAVEAIVKSAGR